MSVRVSPGRAVSPRILAVVFAAWLGTTGALLWHLDAGNRLRGLTCAAPR
ncbi:MAG: hypothetical protein ACK52M_20060 [bacterium]